ITALVYGAVVYISLRLVPPGGTGASLLWPVSAVGLAAVYFWGYEVWPALLLPFFLILVADGYTPPLAATVALGNILESLVGAYLLRQLKFDALIARLSDTLGLVLV